MIRVNTSIGPPAAAATTMLIGRRRIVLLPSAEPGRTRSTAMPISQRLVTVALPFFSTILFRGC